MKEKNINVISTEQNDNYPRQHLITSRLLQAYAAALNV